MGAMLRGGIRSTDNDFVAAINYFYERYKLIIIALVGFGIWFLLIKDVPHRMDILEADHASVRSSMSSITEEVKETNRLLKSLVRFECRNNHTAVTNADIDCARAQLER